MFWGRVFGSPLQLGYLLTDSSAKRIPDMIKPERISVEDVYRRVQSKEALLVCGYNDEGKFKTMQLEGAIAYSEFESRLPGLSKEQEIIFYCA
jgi:hypothetical protein